MNTVILRNRTDVAVWTADHIAQIIARNPDAAIGVAGGSTPVAVHRELVKSDIDWSHTVVWMTDERWVPPSHRDSNQRMVRETLVDDVGVRFLAPDTTQSDPHRVAEAFSDDLVSEGIGTERRSFVMLGMGDDGHCASLFPGTTALTDTAAYTATWVEQHDTWRLTTTYPFLAQSAEVLFLVTGEAKADMIGAIAAGADVPAAHVTAESVTWILDEPAAAGLEQSG